MLLQNKLKILEYLTLQNIKFYPFVKMMLNVNILLFDEVVLLLNLDYILAKTLILIKK